MPQLPSTEMLEPVHRIARFMQTRNTADVAQAFSDTDVTIIDNFFPHVFTGDSAVASWVEGFCRHAQELEDLQYTFGAACDFTTHDQCAFFTLPTTWTGSKNGKHFSEDGGWVFTLSHESDTWRIKAYGWAVIQFTWI